jgi:hypothetical protein
MSQAREKVKFEPNVPVAITLEDGDGVLQPSSYSGTDQYRYFLGENKIVWVSQDVHEMIQATGAQPGQELVITKKEIRQGMQKSVRWFVEPARANGNAHADTYPPANGADPFSNGYQPSGPGETEQQPKPSPFPRYDDRPNPFRTGDTTRAAAAAPATEAQRPAPPAAAPRPKTHAETMRESLEQAVAIAALTEQHAAKASLQIRFTAEDVRAIGITLFIARSEKGGQR